MNIELEPERAARVAEEVGCVFLFAPRYHPAFKTIAPVRAALAKRGVATIFNKLGPLLNPARPAYQLAGVFDPAMVPLYAGVFRELGRERAWAVHGETPAGGLDEMSTMGTTRVAEVVDGVVHDFGVDAAEFGIARPELADLRGGDAAENALTLEALLAGRLPGPIADIVCWNAAGALVVAGVAIDLADGLERAREVIENGEASDRLNALPGKLRRGIAGEDSPRVTSLVLAAGFVFSSLESSSESSVLHWRRCCGDLRGVRTPAAGKELTDADGRSGESAGFSQPGSVWVRS